jgi:hypothetical protein
VLVLRFSATYPDSLREDEIRITVQEGIPDPVFTLPAALAWNGKDSLLLEPSVANMEALKATRDSVLRFAWKVDGMEVDTGWRAEGLMLRKAPQEGEFTVSLCLDNGGTASCKEVAVKVNSATAIRPVSAREARMRANFQEPSRDARGRMLPGRAPMRAFPPVPPR